MAASDRSVPARSRIRLLWLIDSLTIGGAESLVVPFARALRRDDYDLVIGCLTSIGGNRIESELQRIGQRVVNLGARSLRDLGAFLRLMRLIRNERIDLIHAHLTYASIWGSTASRITGVPSVVTLHVAPPSAGRDRIRDRLMQFAASRGSARIVAVSGALAERYAAQRHIDPAKLVTLHNGIDTARFERDPAESRRALERLGVPAHVPVAVTVSVLRDGKGIEVLLNAARTIPLAHFVVVGDGPMREEWMMLAERLGVAPRVHWAGHRSDVETLLAGADVMVHPSLEDAFPTVLLEAMAAGLPVVASAVGGIPEIVTPETGLLVTAGDAAELSAATRRLLDDRTLGRTMGAAGRERARLQFSTGAWIERLGVLYRDVIRTR